MYETILFQSITNVRQLCWQIAKIQVQHIHKLTYEFRKQLLFEVRPIGQFIVSSHNTSNIRREMFDEVQKNLLWRGVHKCIPFIDSPLSQHKSRATSRGQLHKHQTCLTKGLCIHNYNQVIDNSILHTIWIALQVLNYSLSLN